MLAYLAEPAAAAAARRSSTPRDLAFLHRVARRTWSWFERFVGPEDHGLPPDNYQEAPVENVAHRTSPTNIGLALLSTLAAHDLGYITTAELAERIDRTLSTMEGLERHEGHLLNWYDTKTLAPLRPRYVSTVDSGNLAAALIALAHGLREIAAEPRGSRAAARRMPRHRRRPPRERARRRGGPRLKDACLALVRELKALKPRLEDVGPRRRSRPAADDVGATRAGARAVPRGRAGDHAEAAAIVDWGEKLLAALRS